LNIFIITSCVLCRTVIMSVSQPNREFRSRSLKRALNAYVIPVILKKYQVVAIRSLLKHKEEESLIWGKRRRMEMLLNKDDHIAGFFSCITAMEETDKENEERIVLPGVCFWIFFDWPEHGLDAFEVKMIKMFLESGMSINKCTAIKPRGE